MNPSQDVVVQIISAFIGSIGFAIVLKIRGRQIFYAGIGGLMTWCVYLLCMTQLNYFWSNMIAAVFVAFYAEVMARVNKAPATIFLTAAAIPLIPGANLYEMMFGVVSGNYTWARQNGYRALLVALAIGIGFVIIAVFVRYINRIRYFARNSSK